MRPLWRDALTAVLLTLAAMAIIAAIGKTRTVTKPSPWSECQTLDCLEVLR